MTVSSALAEATMTTLVGTCDRCGRLFPATDASDGARSFCEPCREQLWRDEQS